MATKASTLSTINGFITAIVTVLKTRNAFSTIVDTIYTDITTDTNSSTNIVSENLVKTGFDYNIVIMKIGNKVTIKGEFSNNTGFIVGSSTSDYIFTITNSEYLPNNLDNFFMFGTNITSLENVRLNFDTNKLLISSALDVDSVVNFEITYFV